MHWTQDRASFRRGPVPGARRPTSDSACRRSPPSGSSLRRLGAVFVLAASLVVTAPMILRAQQASSAEVGLWLAGSFPRGEFDDFVGTGFGVGGHLSFPISEPGWLRVRLEGGNVVYGREELTVPLSSTIRRVRADVTTTNNVSFLGIGPELARPVGSLRPSVHGLVGLGYLFTQSSVRGSSDDFFHRRGFARTTNFDDLTLALGVGGGLGIVLGPSARSPRLDVGVQYRFQGDARYLREGGIEERPDGSLLLRPIESDTDLLLLRAGVTFGL